MIDETQIKQIHRELSRILALPITRSTLREIQNTLVIVCPEDSNTLFQALVSDETTNHSKISKHKEKLLQMIEEFSVQVRVARDVYERGEFINLASSDIIAQSNRVTFLNRIRRVDGEEMHFFTDTRGTVNLLNHLLERLQELQKNETGKESLKGSKEELKAAKDRLNKLVL
jgi:hypothetical protein